LGGGQVSDDSALFVFREELARVGVVRQKEVGVDAAKYGGDTFAVGELTVWDLRHREDVSAMQAATYRMNIHLQPARPAKPFMKLIA
jgi:hypothetical protein